MKKHNENEPEFRQHKELNFLDNNHKSNINSASANNDNNYQGLANHKGESVKTWSSESPSPTYEIMETDQSNHKKSGIWRQGFELIKFISLTLIIYFIVNTYIFQVNLVSGLSMYPTLKDKDRIFVNKISMNLGRTFKRGDIVTISHKALTVANINHDIIKRIIGLPGETVEIKDEVVYINDRILNEPYLDLLVFTEKNGAYTKVKLGPDEYFVLGDNREHSADGRIFGPINKKHILGFLWFRLYPLSEFGVVK